jgi:RimJ/RimL family protein N-acetyltransferase
VSFLPADATVPEGTRTGRVVLRPLRAADVELDYDAVMSSAPELRRWSQASWPADDFTLAENLADLERHERDPAEARCLGCVYIQPAPDALAATFPPAAHVGAVSFWVRTSEWASGLDAHLLAALRAWFRGEWAFDEVVFTTSAEQTRQAALFDATGFSRPARFTLSDGRRCVAYGAGRASAYGAGGGP